MNDIFRKSMLALVGFVLPWQTRFILATPMVGGAVQDFGVISIYIAQIVLLAALLQEAWICRAEIFIWWRVKSAQRRYQILGGGFSLLLFLQIKFSAQPLLTISGWVSVALLTGLVVVLVKKPELRVPFFGGFLMSTVAQAMLAFVQVFVSATFASTLLGVARHRAADLGTAVVEYGGTRYLRAYGGQPHPNIFGGLMVLALAIYGWSMSIKTSLGEKNNVIKIAAFFGAALFFSYSRSAWGAALLFGLAALAWRAHLSLGQRRFLIWSAGIFGALLIIFWPVVWSRVLPASRLENKSISERVSGLNDWKNITRAHWLVGAGLWNYSAVLPATIGYEMTPVHSVPLLFVAEFGLVGVIFFLLIIWTARNWLKINRRWLLFLIVIFPIAVFDHYLYSLWPGLVILFLGGLLAYLFIEKTAANP